MFGTANCPAFLLLFDFDFAFDFFDAPFVADGAATAAAAAVLPAPGK